MPDSSCQQECWVFKLGGSLLSLPDLGERLRAVIRQVSHKPLLVVGGGAAADVVREWDAVHHLDSSAAHWLAIRAMEFNQRLIETLLPEAVGVSHPAEAARVWQQNGIAVLNAFAWLQGEEDQPESLPHSWEVTSDSIAAFAALRWQAAGLMLLKSVDAPGSIQSIDEACKGLVDDGFSRFVPQLPRIAWCNLQSNPHTIKTTSRES